MYWKKISSSCHISFLTATKQLKNENIYTIPHYLEQQFEQILAEHKERIFRICRVYAVAPIEPQDLFQEVIFQVWKSFSSFKGKSKISTWIYRIAVNVCHRSKMRFDKRNHKMVRFESIQFLPAEDALDEEQQERYSALKACISVLNESDRTIVVLYLEELPYKEIASITGLTENHIAVKMKRIKKLLFECITQKLS